MRLSWAFPLRHFQLHWLSSMDIGPRGCLRTCCRRSGISSAHTPMNGLINQEDNSSIPIGPAAAAVFHRPRTTLRRRVIHGIDLPGLLLSFTHAKDLLKTNTYAQADYHVFCKGCRTCQTHRTVAPSRRRRGFLSPTS